MKMSSRQGIGKLELMGTVWPKSLLWVCKVTGLKTPGKKYEQRKEEVSTKALQYFTVRELKWKQERWQRSVQGGGRTHGRRRAPRKTRGEKREEGKGVGPC